MSVIMFGGTVSYFYNDNTFNTLTQLDPPLSGGLIKYQGVPAALLYFTVVITTLFLSFALVLLVSNTALKRKRYVYLLNGT